MSGRDVRGDSAALGSGPTTTSSLLPADGRWEGAVEREVGVSAKEEAEEAGDDAREEEAEA